MAAAVFGCNGNDIECGPGTQNQSGECIAVPVESVECGDQTMAVDGVCVVADNLCPDGQVYAAGSCRPRGAECGADTRLFNGTCVPAEDLCPTGQVYVSGACRMERGCGPGTMEMDGQCQLIDPFADVTVMEASEPNAPDFEEGAATALAVPSEGQTVVASGALSTRGDSSQTDFDSFVFTGTAGQQVRVEVSAVGAPRVGFMLRGPSDYERLVLPFDTRNAERVFILPVDGTDEVTVAHPAALAQRAQVSAVQIFGEAGLILPGVDPSFTYLLALTQETPQAPMTVMGSIHQS